MAERHWLRCDCDDCLGVASFSYGTQVHQDSRQTPTGAEFAATRRIKWAVDAIHHLRGRRRPRT